MNCGENILAAMEYSRLELTKKEREAFYPPLTCSLLSLPANYSSVRHRRHESSKSVHSLVPRTGAGHSKYTA